MKIRNAVGAFVIMYALIALVVGGFSGIKEGYDIEEGNLDSEDKNVFQKLSEMNLLQGTEELGKSIERLGKVSNPFDLVGAIALGAFGTLQVIGGIVTFPIEIFGIITGFYANIIPPVVTRIIGLLGVLTVAFILLSAKLGFEL